MTDDDNRPPAEDDPGLRQLLSAWAVATVEPLMAPSRRTALAKDVVHAAGKDPAFYCAWLSLSLNSVLSSLPATDPWRHLAGRIGNLTCGPPDVDPPEDDGAIYSKGAGRGTRFGSGADDVSDLIEPMFSDPAHDPALAAVADGLEPAAAALIAFAGMGWESCNEAARGIFRDAMSDRSAAQRGAVLTPDRWHSSVAAAVLTNAGNAGLLYAIFRRRAYLGGPGVDDGWPVEAMFRATHRAHRIVLGERWDEAEVAREISMQAIPEPGIDSYETSTW